jgi:hypothetical protein
MSEQPKIAAMGNCAEVRPAEKSLSCGASAAIAGISLHESL